MWFTIDHYLLFHRTNQRALLPNVLHSRSPSSPLQTSPIRPDPLGFHHGRDASTGDHYPALLADVPGGKPVVGRRREEKAGEGESGSGQDEEAGGTDEWAR